jgi:hypothetical protein
LNGRGRSESRAVVFAERLGEQTACVRAPRKVVIAKSFDGVGIGVEPLDCGGQCSPSLRRIEVACELEHRRVLEGRLAVEISARGEDEERPPKRRIPF